MVTPFSIAKTSFFTTASCRLKPIPITAAGNWVILQRIIKSLVEIVQLRNHFKVESTSKVILHIYQIICRISNVALRVRKSFSRHFLGVPQNLSLFVQLFTD